MVFHAGFYAVYAKIETIDIAALRVVGKIEIGPTVLQELFAEGGAIVFVSIGPAVHPDKGEGIGGVVGVLDGDIAVEGFVGVVEADIDVVVDPLLEVGLGRREERAGDGEEQEDDDSSHD